MFKISLHLCLFLLLNYFHYGASVNYSPYSNNHGYHNQQHASNDYAGYQEYLQGNSNYPQLYRYYYTPPYQQQQQQQQQQQNLQLRQPTQLWSGAPIVVEDDIQQKQQSSSTNIPPTFYQQHSTGSVSRNGELLPFLYRNSKVLPPTLYNPQPTSRTAHFNYNNNNNNNIVYHKDLRQQIDAIPESQRTQQEIVSWNNQQLLLGQQRPQQFYETKTNSHDWRMLRRDNLPDYGEHFKRYLENNPHRIKPIY